jgi:hypothetical protein
MNKIVLFALALFLAGPVLGNESIYGIVARVNGEVITLSELIERYSKPKMEIMENYSGKEADEKLREARKVALNDLIDKVLICDDFKAKGVVVPEKVIDEIVEKIITKEFKGDKKPFIASLEEQGYTLDQFRDLKRKDIMVQYVKQWNAERSDDPAERQKLLADYLADLRKNAFIQILTEVN